MATEPERWARRLETSFGDMQAFYDACFSRVAEAIRYCDGFDLGDMPDEATSMLQLLCSFEDHADAPATGDMSEGGGHEGLAHADRTEDERVASLFDEAQRDELGPHRSVVGDLGVLVPRLEHHVGIEPSCSCSSSGFGVRWRRALVSAVAPQAGQRVLDVATGTGMVAAELLVLVVRPSRRRVG